MIWITTKILNILYRAMIINKKYTKISLTRRGKQMVQCSLLIFSSDSRYTIIVYRSTDILPYLYIDSCRSMKITTS